VQLSGELSTDHHWEFHEKMHGTPADSNGDQCEEHTPESVIAVLGARGTWETAMGTQQNEAARNRPSPTQSPFDDQQVFFSLNGSRHEDVGMIFLL